MKAYAENPPSTDEVTNQRSLDIADRTLGSHPPTRPHERDLTTRDPLIRMQLRLAIGRLSFTQDTLHQLLDFGQSDDPISELRLCAIRYTIALRSVELALSTCEQLAESGLPPLSLRLSE